MVKQATIIAGAGWGDEGKGALVDAECANRAADLVVFYNGGAQRAHNVVTPQGRHHTFRQFGSGTFAGAATHHSEYSRINPYDLLIEASQLASLGESNILDRITIHENAMIITPYDILYDRWWNSKNKGQSCGAGVGSVVEYVNEYGYYSVIFAKDLSDSVTLKHKLDLIRQRRIDAMRIKDTSDLWSWDRMETVVNSLNTFSDKVRIISNEHWLHMRDTTNEIVFEGSQGALLDRDHGYTDGRTSSVTTFANASELLQGYVGSITKIACIRMYHTRHGSGDFPSESHQLTMNIREPHNNHNPYQLGFRAGWYDHGAMSYAVKVLRPNYMVVSHLDQWDRIDRWQYLPAGRLGDPPDRRFLGKTQDVLDLIESLGVSILATRNGPTREHMEYR